MIDRESAFQLLEMQNPEPHLVHHALQTEAVMNGLARHFGEDEALWSITGLLHDLDFPSTKETPEKHGKQSVELLKGKLPEIALNAILAHNSEYTKHDPTTKLDIALRCAETVTGLIATNALVRPNGMEGMKPKSLKKKMKDKAFAASVSRDRIRECEKLDLDLGQFFQLAIESITPIADSVGLAKRT
ncbi:HD domain-containing protein [Halodesulfovibrio sp.]|jgi:putative nucleotidyltransferase with HDIG domain|uniref:HD domain-containing protein n=1 Tax=Halodesulfovibrio sp. TaxID=1912772 RepID=UPI0025D5CF61|nr:HD domain-containing protein [Halodesulfovibrio sp.]MCT4626704.1 HDIG domain-containing protein [Halodesulfovibrio sp.]